jgi:hypothetical protein
MFAMIIALSCAHPVREIEVTASDYAFQAPDTLAPGPTVFHMRNTGTVSHEMGLTRLRDGATPAGALSAELRDGRTDSVYDRGSALLDGVPGGPGDIGIFVDLLPGRTYVLTCNHVDGPGKPTHVALGMFHAFVVKK